MKKKNIILCLFALILILILFKEKFISSSYNPYKDDSILHASKCFSCEQQLPPQKLYLSQKTKCFSCEQDLIKRNQSPSLGQPIKCFSCL